jgi:hypothetical protein
MPLTEPGLHEYVLYLVERLSNVILNELDFQNWFG